MLKTVSECGGVSPEPTSARQHPCAKGAESGKEQRRGYSGRRPLHLNVRKYDPRPLPDKPACAVTAPGERTGCEALYGYTGYCTHVRLSSFPARSVRAMPAFSLHTCAFPAAPRLHTGVLSCPAGPCTGVLSCPAGPCASCVLSRPTGACRSEPTYSWLTTDTPLGEDRSQSKTRVPRLSPPAGRQCKYVSEDALTSSV